MLSYSSYEKLRHWIKCELRRLCDKTVTGSHQKICDVDSFEDIFVVKCMNTCHISIERILCKASCFSEILEVLSRYVLKSVDLCQKLVPDIPVISDIYHDRGSALLYRRHQILKNRFKNIRLCSGSSDSK